MDIELSKGMEIPLMKEDDLLSNMEVELSWDKNKEPSGAEFDADLTLAELSQVGYDADNEPVMNILGHDVGNLLYYNNKAQKTNDGAFTHSGDNMLGGSETVYGNLDIVNPACPQVDVVGTIYEGLARGQSWGNMNARIRLINKKTKKVVAHYDLGNDFADCTAIQFGSFVRTNDGWKWETVGIGFREGLGAFTKMWTEKPVRPV